MLGFLKFMKTRVGNSEQWSLHLQCDAGMRRVKKQDASRSVPVAEDQELTLAIGSGPGLTPQAVLMRPAPRWVKERCKSSTGVPRRGVGRTRPQDVYTLSSKLFANRFILKRGTH